MMTRYVMVITFLLFIAFLLKGAWLGAICCSLLACAAVHYQRKAESMAQVDEHEAILPGIDNDTH